MTSTDISSSTAHAESGSNLLACTTHGPGMRAKRPSSTCVGKRMALRSRASVMKAMLHAPWLITRACPRLATRSAGQAQIPVSLTSSASGDRIRLISVVRGLGLGDCSRNEQSSELAGVSAAKQCWAAAKGAGLRRRHAGAQNGRSPAVGRRRCSGRSGIAGGPGSLVRAPSSWALSPSLRT